MPSVLAQLQVGRLGPGDALLILLTPLVQSQSGLWAVWQGMGCSNLGRRPKLLSRAPTRPLKWTGHGPAPLILEFLQVPKDCGFQPSLLGSFSHLFRSCQSSLSCLSGVIALYSVYFSVSWKNVSSPSSYTMPFWTLFCPLEASPYQLKRVFSVPKMSGIFSFKRREV